MKYDTIIVGAGIAGVSAAIHIKKLNKKAKILVIDKYEFPRNKLCAGYLTSKSVSLLEELGIDITKIDYKLVKGIKIIYKNKTRLYANNHGLYCQKLVDRTVLDFELFKKLKEKNIEVIEKAKINKLNEQESVIIINNNKYYFNNLVFSDGQAGYSTKFNSEKKKYFAMQINFKQKKEPKIDMYFGITKKGYAWCASSGSYVNIGFCDIYNNKNDYKLMLENFVKELGFEKELSKNKIKGFFVPYGLKKNKIINENIYLIGDAAGAVDPLTLAGVSYALLSGKFVAKSIVNNNNKIYLKYIKKVSLKFKILKVITNVLYNPLTMFFGIRLGGHFFKNIFAYILDKFVLNKNSSFHE
jgi:Dehydrogenases (flavoproteins)